jgi:thioredoxin reductase (NADPH)
MTSHVHDTLIIGGGPGGLTAAIYLRRFTRDVAVVDKGNSRLRLIPVSHNYPGFPEGVPGTTLLANLNAQLERYGGSVMRRRDSRPAHRGRPVRRRLPARRRPRRCLDADPRPHRAAGHRRGRRRPADRELARGDRLRRRAPVPGVRRLRRDGQAHRRRHFRTNPVGHALFMRTFSADVTLFERGPESMLDDDDRRQPGRRRRAPISSRRCCRVTLDAAMKPVMHTEDGEPRVFADVFYPMLGDRRAPAWPPRWAPRPRNARNWWSMTMARPRCRGCTRSATWCGPEPDCGGDRQAARAATRIHNLLPPALRTRP